MSEKILVLGSGGREHALCWHLSKYHYRAFCSPGSDAIKNSAECFEYHSYEQLLSEIRSREISLVIVGPEAELSEGIADFLEDRDIQCFGPRQAAARLESDKAFAKAFAEEFQIPTAQAKTIKLSTDVKEALESFRPPYVIKASGLAAGKGVWIGDDVEQAEIVAKRFLESHYSIVIEDFLLGEELSCFALVDGENFIWLGESRDHKRLLDGDQGPNTGGMGTYSTPEICSDFLRDRIQKQILQPTLAGLRSRGIFYRGFIFLGLMIDRENPFLLEYNCRLGDPETQSLLMRLKTPLPEMIKGLRQNQLMAPILDKRSALSVVVSAAGYPSEARKGFPIPLLELVPPELIVFHSGTKLSQGQWMANGGRLFSLNCLEENLNLCRRKIYDWLNSQNQIEHLHFRKDIGGQDKSF